VASDQTRPHRPIQPVQFESLFHCGWVTQVPTFDLPAGDTDERLRVTGLCAKFDETALDVLAVAGVLIP
jgi:hypothetical protein